jgi:hypothetical protein
MESRRDFLVAMASAVFAAQEDNGLAAALQIIRVESRAIADTIASRLKAGESFEALAAQYSLDPSAPRGGYIGKLKISTLRPELREALQGVGPGQVTPVVQTPAGYVILKTLSPADALLFEARALSKPVFQPAQFNYKLVTSVVGDAEVESYFRQISKPPNYEQDLRLVRDLRHAAVSGGIQQLQSRLGDPTGDNDLSPDARDRRMHDHYTLAQLYSYQGEIENAIVHFKAVYDLAASAGAQDEFQVALEKILGIAHLRRGEVDNCLGHHNVHMCVFPLCSEAQHKFTSGSDAAIQHFLKYLDNNPDDLEEKWLLNLAYMTVGKYPAEVPRKHLIPPATFESKETLGPFLDVAPSVGLNVLSTAGGVIMEDFDNDGFLDLVVSGMEPGQHLRYFHNNGDGTFTDRSIAAGLADQLGGLNLVQADYNNDGWMDILVMRGGWLTPVRRSLLRNNGNGTFTDVTRQAGLALPATASQTVAWADFDNDGWLDLFVGNENAPAQLFRNNRDGTFTDIARAAGVDRIAYSKACVAGDYDNDGYPDIYVSNYRGENFLYHNNHDGTFAEVARDLHVEKPIFSFPTFFFDYDNDGWLDLFVSSYIVSVSEVTRTYLGLPLQAETLKLYKNTHGSFRDVTKEVGLNRVLMPMGANFGDINNEGHLDFYLGTGSPSYASLVPNVLFKNKGGTYFADITTPTATGILQKGHGVAIGNLFNDGDPVIFSETGGMAPGDAYISAVFKNVGCKNKWIDVKLVGVKTNRAAIGARIKLDLKSKSGERRTIYRNVTSGGSFGASPLEQHIGLGEATRIESMEIWWPTSGTRQLFQNVGINQFVEVKEFALAYSQMKRKTIKLSVT